MIAGRLRERVSIEEKTQSKDEFMQVVNGSSEVINVRAEHQPKNGRIRFSQGVQIEQKYDRFIIRYSELISADMDLIHNDNKYRIISASPFDQKKRLLVIEAELINDI